MIFAGAKIVFRVQRAVFSNDGVASGDGFDKSVAAQRLSQSKIQNPKSKINKKFSILHSPFSIRSRGGRL